MLKTSLYFQGLRGWRHGAFLRCNDSSECLFSRVDCSGLEGRSLGLSEPFQTQLRRERILKGKVSLDLHKEARMRRIMDSKAWACPGRCRAHVSPREAGRQVA